MTGTADTDWNPGTYHRFRGLRLRPALDLLAQVGRLPGGDIVDLGCGSGAAAPALRARFGKERRLLGVDNSSAMLTEARNGGGYDALLRADAASWQAETPPALIFSNAALHWVGDHAALFPRLVEMLAPGGTLAVQMPHQNNAPSHRLWVALVDELYPGRHEHGSEPSILLPAEYYRLLSARGTFTLWETEYYQHLPAETEAHPVRAFTEATFARPILNALEPHEQDRLCAAFDKAVAHAYPRLGDGGVLFPFRRLFFTLRRD